MITNHLDSPMLHTKSLDDPLVDLRRKVKEAEERHHAHNEQYEALNNRFQAEAEECDRANDLCEILEALVEARCCVRCCTDLTDGPSNAGSGFELQTSNSYHDKPLLSGCQLPNQPNRSSHLPSQSTSIKPPSSLQDIAQFGKPKQEPTDTLLSSQSTHCGEIVTSGARSRALSTSSPSQVPAVSGLSSALQPERVVLLGSSSSSDVTDHPETRTLSSSQLIHSAIAGHPDESSGPFTAPLPDSLPASSSRLSTRNDISEPRGRGSCSSMLLSTTGAASSNLVKQSRDRVLSPNEPIGPTDSSYELSSIPSKNQSLSTLNVAAANGTFPKTTAPSLPPVTQHSDRFDYPGQGFHRTVPQDINMFSRDIAYHYEDASPIAMRMPPPAYNIASSSTVDWASPAGRMVRSPAMLFPPLVGGTSTSSLLRTIHETSLILSPGKRVRGADPEDDETISRSSMKRRRLSSPPVEAKVEEGEEGSVPFNAVAGSSCQGVYRGPDDMNHPPRGMWVGFSDDDQSQASRSTHWRSSRPNALRRW
ncbi:hypothetical protein JAAARDRAFT_208673 [Jaapia argillacea MUCL 33604]|uniref:Uncharacterized protein n=1 Tax=Jaapia argillacea MUCL 33604 TaxID=933084 RepID=A0A067PNI0_9AGAM|nr:hypothetical protein JAAARDRAFT_208673 [Jaapia argillacea MUCL 33604]